jgi:hypothetical protein
MHQCCIQLWQASIHRQLSIGTPVSYSFISIVVQKLLSCGTVVGISTVGTVG